MKTSLCAVLGALALVSTGRAALTATGPFTGTASESFEGFPNYADNGYMPLTEPVTILDGLGSLTSANGDIYIYEPGVADFGLGSGNAQVADGSKGAGLLSSGDAFQISFAHPVTEFGGYFGAANGPFYSGDITFDFSDGSTQTFNYSDPTGSGALTWLGWTSDVGLSSVDISGDFVVADHLQAAPDTASTALCLLLGGVALAIGMRRRSVDQRAAGA